MADPETRSYRPDDEETRSAAPATGPSQRRSPNAGERVGPYRLDGQLGAGSFGEVWLATREGELAHTRLAVKLPHGGTVDLAAFRREAAVWARVGGHPNVLPLFEAAVYDDRVVIVSEYAADGTLADWLTSRGGRAAPTDVVPMVAGVLDGLSHLHRLGVHHGDIKPANVLLQSGTPRLADFGLASVATDGPSGRLAGTPAYMAPEAFAGTVTAASDIWSTGVLLYRALSGSVPFRGSGLKNVAAAVLTAEFDDLSDEVPAGLRAVVRTALTKDPAGRYASAEAMAADLRTALDPAANDVRVLVHEALFAGLRDGGLFINVANVSERSDREVTHVWLATAPEVHVDNPSRPLPKRLRPQEAWETWLGFHEIPVSESAAALAVKVRVRLSNGRVVVGRPNPAVPAQGRIPGGDVLGAAANVGTRGRAWWKFWR